MPQEMQQIEKLVGELQTGLKAIQDTHAKAQNDTNTMVQQKLENIAQDMSKKYEELQDGQSKLRAVLERSAANDNDGKETAEQRAQKAAFEKFLRNGKNALTPDEQKSLSTDVNPSGGYLVPTQQLGIITGRIFESSPMREVATVITTSAKSVEMVLDDDEASSGWAGEGDTPSETNTPALGRLEIACHKQYAYPKMTEELVQDAAFDVNAWLMRKLGDKFGRVENTAFISGDGVKQPRGLLTYSAWGSAGVYERNKIEQINSGSTSAPTENGLIGLQTGLKEAYQRNARWIMNRSTFAAILKLNGSTNYRFLSLQPVTGPNGANLGSELTLMQKPLRLFADMPDIATNSLSIGYGDFAQAYTIIDRAGISVKQDGITSPGFYKFYSTKRVGGAVTNFDAVKLQKFNT